VALTLEAETRRFGPVVGPHRLEHLLRVRDAERALLGNATGELEPGWQELVVVHGAIGQSPSHRLVGRQEPTAEDQLGRALATDGTGQQGEYAATAHLAEVEVPVADRGRAGNDGEVAVEDELEPARRGDTVHQGDRGDGQTAEPPERVVQLLDETRERDRVALERDVLRQIPAGAERPPRAGHEHASHRRVGGDLVDRAVERAQHVPVDGVELIGAVEPEDRGVRATPAELASLDEDGRVRPAHVRARDASIRRISCFCTLPDAVVGRTSSTSSTSGSLYDASPASRNRCTIVSRSSDASARSTTHAQERSPNRSSGSPTTAARSTSGNAVNKSSISRGAMFSPPR